MIRFVARRALAACLVLLAISVLTFVIFEVLPDSDPSARIAGRQASQQEIAQVRQQWGFNQPLYVQYVRTIEKVLDGTVVSYTEQVNVESAIWQGIPVTLSVCLGAAALWLVGGIVVGVLSATYARRAVDRVLTVLSLVGVSTPSFLLGAVLLYYFAYRLQWLPLGGYVGLTASPLGWLDHMILPWLTLSAAFVGVYSRVLRGSMLDMNSESFVRTAQAKGLSDRQVTVRHVLRNSLLPIIALWGLDFAGVIGGGDILVESVFNLRGVGQYAAQSIAQLDVPSVLVIVMFAALAVVVLSAVVDVLYAALDPRVRLT